MVYFSFTAGFTWCTTASLVRFTNIFFSCLPDTQFADCINCLTTQRNLFQFSQTIAFWPFHTFEFCYFWICFIPTFHVFAIFLSQSAPACSAEQQTNIFLVTWLAHNLLFAWPASPHRYFYFGFKRQLHFCQFIYIWVWICLNMFHSWFFHSQSFYPSVLQQAKHSNHRPLPKRVSSTILVCNSNPNSYLSIGTHSCSSHSSSSGFTHQ